MYKSEQKEAFIRRFPQIIADGRRFFWEDAVVGKVHETPGTPGRMKNFIRRLPQITADRRRFFGIFCLNQDSRDSQIDMIFPYFPHISILHPENPSIQANSASDYSPVFSVISEIIGVNLRNLRINPHSPEDRVICGQIPISPRMHNLRIDANSAE